jgi:hypothetical protein
VRSTEELWLATLQRLAGITAHELKGALNGVAVNLEVIRSRGERNPVADASSESNNRFAKSASAQLEAVIGMTEGLLALARAPRQPVDLATILRQVHALVGPVVAAGGGRLECIIEGSQTRSSVDPNAARLAVATARLVAQERGGEGRCECSATAAGSPTLSVSTSVAADVIDGETLAALAAAGIAVQTDGHGISIEFPGLTGALIEDT